MGSEALSFIHELGHCLKIEMREQRSLHFLLQRLSVAMQRGNAELFALFINFLLLIFLVLFCFFIGLLYLISLNFNSSLLYMYPFFALLPIFILLVHILLLPWLSCLLYILKRYRQLRRLR